MECGRVRVRVRIRVRVRVRARVRVNARVNVRVRVTARVNVRVTSRVMVVYLYSIQWNVLHQQPNGEACGGNVTLSSDKGQHT